MDFKALAKKVGSCTMSASDGAPVVGAAPDEGSRKIEPRAMEAQPCEEPEGYTETGTSVSLPIEDVFPKNIAALIRELQRAYGYPPEFTAAAILCAYSVACGNRYKLQYKPHFIATAMLYMMLVGPPNSCKTPPLQFVFSVFKKRERGFLREYTRDCERLKEWENASAAERQDRDLTAPPKPKLRQIILKDSTIEYVKKAICDNPAGVCIHSDEFLGWLGNLSKYTPASNPISDYLSIWSGEGIKVGRRTTEVYDMPDPFLSIIGGTQVAMLKDIYGGQRDANGFTDRVLPVFPDNLTIPKWTDDEIDQNLVTAFTDSIERLLNIELIEEEEAGLSTVMLHFTPEARRFITDWRNGAEHRERLLQERSATWATAHGKMDIYALRFALIMQVMYYAVEGEPLDRVGMRAVQAAIKLVAYFKSEIVKIHDIVYGGSKKIANDIERKVYEALPNRFTTQQGQEIALKHGMEERTYFRFTSKKRGIFSTPKTGHREKI